MANRTIELLPEAARALSAVVEIVPEREWSAPSPDEGWTVRDVLNHVTSEHLWAPRLLRGETVAEVGDAYDGDVLGDDPVGAWKRAMAASLQAWAQADASGSVHVSFGEISVEEYAHQMLLDLTVHGWDIAAGAGVAYAPVADAVEDAIAYWTPRAEQGVAAGIFKPATGYDGENRLGVLLGLTGRTPYRRG